jgi:hypothetical protein
LIKELKKAKNERGTKAEKAVDLGGLVERFVMP